MTCHIENRYAFGRMWCVAVRDCDGVVLSSLQDCADIQYKIDRGYFPCDTPCATTLVVNSVTATKGGLLPNGAYEVTVVVNFTGTGTIIVTLNGVEKDRLPITAGRSLTYVWGFLPGTYQICAEAI